MHKKLVVGQRGIYWDLLKNIGITGVWNHSSEGLESLIRGHPSSGSVFPCDSGLAES